MRTGGASADQRSPPWGQGGVAHPIPARKVETGGVKMTLSYRGPLPTKQRGVSPVKSALREHFHPQIRDQSVGMMSGEAKVRLTTDVGDYRFRSPAHSAMRTAVELDVMILAPRGRTPPGDLDNRLKTLIDGLTRPASEQQLLGHVPPSEGGPTYCLMDDDALVERISVDSRPWFDPTASVGEVLVIVTAELVLAPGSDFSTPLTSMFLLM